MRCGGWRKHSPESSLDETVLGCQASLEQTLEWKGPPVSRAQEQPLCLHLSLPRVAGRPCV